jgi:ABC-type antimicrobial peptide transport system permease subunit
MFFNLKIMLRNLQRGGIYSAINVGGLAIGMAAAILILTWIHHEWSYDRFHTNEKNIYVAYNRATFDGDVFCWDRTPIILGPTLKADYPEIARIARMKSGDEFLFTHESNKSAMFKIRTGMTDPDFLTLFDFPLLHGDKESALDDPFSVILTEQAAIRLFGEEDPMGQMLLLENQYSMTVTGVMKDLPGNTMFRFDALVPMEVLKRMELFWAGAENWTSNSIQTFVELQPNVGLERVNEAIRDITNAHTDNTAETEVFLYPLGKRHLYSRFENGVAVGCLIESLRMFGVIAGLILLIACINFMNLSTARSAKRAKEVGVRKVMGGKRGSLVRLFFGESMLVAFVAGAVALVLALMALPVFGTLMRQSLALDLTNVWFWMAWAGFVVLTGLLAGSYPAFHLSSFRPVKVLKGVVRTKQSLVSPRKVLVVVQFTVASALIVSTLVIHRQIKYAQDRETGYNKEQLIYTVLEDEVAKNDELIKHELLNSGAATSVTKTMSPMSQGWNNTWGVEWRGKDPNSRIIFDMYCADADWTKTTGTTIVEGRDIDAYTYPTDSTAMLLNEAAVKIMNLEQPIGSLVATQGVEWHVVGVVKDFIISSPYEPVAPMLICGAGGWFNVMHIKLSAHNHMADNLAKVEQIFKQYNFAYPFEYRFIDEDYARRFQNEKKTGTMGTLFACLTIFISCLGLFALVAYMAETRRKEIGIRKVLGASVYDIVMLLSKEFLILTLISVAIASPVAWWIMEKWLAGYAYRTNTPWWLFVAVGCLSLCIALATVGFQAIRAATANPVEAIKSE